MSNSAALSKDLRTWNQLLAPYKGANRARSIYQLVSTLALFGLNWYLMYRSLEVGYWLTLLLTVPAAGLYIRLFIFQHDCGHGSFFRSSWANNLVGGFLGVISLMPYRYWRRTHAIHHATSGDLDRRELGDIDTLTVDEYQALSRWGKLGYRIYRHPVILFGFGPFYQFVLKHRLPFDAPLGWRREWVGVMLTNLSLAAIVAMAWTTIGIVPFLLVQTPIILAGGGIGMFLFYVQHQFEDTYWEHTSEWDYVTAGIKGSSFFDLPQILHWYTGNIGYHHVHHLASRIPNYNLRRAVHENPELLQVSRISLADSLSTLRLRLWDERHKKLIGFRELRKTAAAG